ncbi:hypothetical protein G4B88_004759, partial [Cannabis sativa]
MNNPPLQVMHSLTFKKNAYKALIVAEYNGLNIEFAPNFEMGVSDKTPQFINMNPIGKSPVLETPDGPIFESNAIALARSNSKADNALYGSSLIEYIDANLLTWFRPTVGRAPYYGPVEEAAISGLKRGLGALNTHLASNTYMVGHSVTLADIITTCNLVYGFTKLMTKAFTSEFPHVERYFWTMVNLPNFKKIFGEVNQTHSLPPVQSLAPTNKE